jgi:hypothetical protein
VAKNSYPVRVSDDGEAAVWDPDMNMWCSTTGARLSATQVEGWAPYVKFEEPGAAVFADALNEWAAHWPPKVGNDVELEPIYAPLNDLSPEQLEQLAVAASSLSSRCWEVRGSKLVEESRAAQGITWAHVNVTAGRLRPSSVVTVGEASAPVPLSTDTGGIIAAHRLSAALRTLGYKAVDWRDTVLDGDTLSFLVRKVSAGE